MAATEEIEKEILAEMAANPVPYAAGQVNDVITIDGETRMISVPASEIFFGVESDKDVERKHFRCPKVVGDGIDLSKHQIYISYITSDSAGKTFSGNAGLYLCEDVATDGDDITFSWQLSGNVFASAGFIAFKVLAAKTDGENVQTRWNTVPAIGTVLMTVPDGMDIGEAYPDIVTQLLERMASVEKIATEEAMQGYVNTYLEAHPGEIDETLTDPKKAAPASVVGELKGDLDDITKPSRNLYEIDSTYEKTLGGITVKSHTNYITVNGTATANVSFVLPTIFTMVENTKYTFSGCPNGGGENSYRLDLRNSTDESLALTIVYDYGNGFVAYFTTTKQVRIGIRVISGQTINEVFKPMIIQGEMLGESFIPYRTAYDDNAKIKNDEQDALLESIENNLKKSTGYNLTYGRNALTFIQLSSTETYTLHDMLDNTYTYCIFDMFTDLGTDFPLDLSATGFVYKFGNRTKTGQGTVKNLIAIDTNGKSALGKINGSGSISWFENSKRNINLAMFGDSITWGRDGGGSATTQTTNPFATTIANILNISATNYGNGGQGFFPNSEESVSAIQELQAHDIADFDVVSMAWGINDSAQPLGVHTDTTDSTIMGRMYQCLQYVYSQNDKATIIIIAPFGSFTSGTAPDWTLNTARPGGWTMQEMIDEYRKFAEYYHLPFISCEDAPINRFTPREMIPDGIHPNNDTYKILGRYLAGQISKFI